MGPHILQCMLLLCKKKNEQVTIHIVQPASEREKPCPRHQTKGSRPSLMEIVDSEKSMIVWPAERNKLQLIQQRTQRYQRPFLWEVSMRTVVCYFECIKRVAGGAMLEYSCGFSVDKQRHSKRPGNATPHVS